jgi:murein DD-endopeptidase MepM/ murein hydrolase activator NlpD
MAADGGTVIYTGNSGSYGKHIKIKHSDGYVTLYAHLSAISVNNGDSVYQGQKIGEIGSTGRSTGNHLHFEIIKNGVQVNPLSYFN